MLETKAKQQVINHIIATKNKIQVNPGKCRYNYQCAQNSVHEAIEHNEDKVAMCVYIDNDWPVVHFININKDGEFFDNTLGHWSSQYEFYLVKYIDKEDFFEINDIFIKYCQELRNQMSPIVRLLCDIKFYS